MWWQKLCMLLDIVAAALAFDHDDVTPDDVTPVVVLMELKPGPAIRCMSFSSPVLTRTGTP
jgi:hypothetical protein